jgi:hypothetical protein
MSKFCFQARISSNDNYKSGDRERKGKSRTKPNNPRTAQTDRRKRKQRERKRFGNI